MSGISVYTCRLTNALADTHPVSAILMRRLLPRRLYPGAERVGTELGGLAYQRGVPVFDGVDYFWVPSLVRSLRFLRSQRPDVVLMQWWTGTVLHSYLVLALAGRLLGARVVIEFHEVLDTAEAAQLLPRLYVQAMLRPLLRLADAVVVHSEFDRDVVAREYKLTITPMVVVPHGPYDHFGAGTARRGRANGGPGRLGGPYTLLFFGTIRPYKGLEYLIEAFDALSDEEASGFRLLIVGETWEGWTRPAELIASSPHQERITFINRYVHDREVADVFAEADAVVLPYTRSSSSGPLHIAMSQGLPVIITAVGGLREAAAPYEGTTFVRPHNAEDLRAAILDLPLRDRRRFDDVHSWERSVALLQAVLH